MPKSHPPYPPEVRQQIVELVPAGVYLLRLTARARNTPAWAVIASMPSLTPIHDKLLEHVCGITAGLLGPVEHRNAVVLRDSSARYRP
jgi:hypothetical protein